jgi:hypothetical protein
MLVVIAVEVQDEARLQMIGNLLAWGTEWLPVALQPRTVEALTTITDVFPLVALCLDGINKWNCSFRKFGF